MNKTTIQKLYKLASNTNNSQALQRACLKALSQNNMRLASESGAEVALESLSPVEQAEVKIGVFSELTNKIAKSFKETIPSGFLESFQKIIVETGLANKIRRMEKIVARPKNDFEKLISKKAKSAGSASDSLAFIARITKADTPEEIVQALDVSMEEFKDTIENVLGETITDFLGSGYQKFYYAVAEIKEVSKLYTAELAITILEISVVSFIVMFFGGTGSIAVILGKIGHGILEVIALVVGSLILLDLKDSAQFIRKQDVFIKAIPIVIVNDIIRFLKWSWAQTVKFFTPIIKDTSEFFSLWYGKAKDALSNLYTQTFKLASENPQFRRQLLEIL